MVYGFEEILKETNEKLLTFAEKMSSVEQFDIRGMVTLTRHMSFVSAVIGDVSLQLIRDAHIGYSMQNDSDSRHKISLFSDIIEGDVERTDRLYFFGSHIDQYVDMQEREEVARTVFTQRDDTLKPWADVLQTRMAAEQLGMIVEYACAGAQKGTTSRGFSLPWVSFPSLSAHNIQTPSFVSDSMKHVRGAYDMTLYRIREKLHQKQFVVLLLGAWVFLLFVLRSIIHGWIQNTASQSINPDGTITASLSIDDIKKEIAAFQKLDPKSEEKSVKYNAIIKELQRIQSEGKRADDVQQLKKIIDSEYYQGFNIITFDTLDEQMIYHFSSLEKSAIEKPIQLFFSKWLYVAWTRGALLAGISDDIKGTVVRSVVNDDFTTCSLNLIKNGIYCATTKDALYHISKIGSEAIAGELVVFPWSVAGIATFGSSSMYLLTNDKQYSKDKTYILKFTNSLGSQNTFASSQALPLSPTTSEDITVNGLQSLAIDGSFLTRSAAKKTLLQLYRNPQDKVLTAREVPLKWWVKLGDGYSDNVKVMTTQGTRYVYLYDRSHQTLTIYISNPAKNSDAYSNNYSLEYVMRADLSSLPTPPHDLIVDESDGKQVAYVLTDAGVAKVPMSDLLESLKKSRLQYQAGQ
jgi:hypothetical protein